MNIWCVKHRDGWCATDTGKAFKEGVFTVKTMCQHHVCMPYGCEYREPTCKQCLTMKHMRVGPREKGWIE